MTVTVQSNTWNWDKVRSFAIEHKPWKIMNNSHKGIDKREVMNFLYFITTSNAIAFDFLNEKDFSNAIINRSTEFYSNHFDKCQKLLTTPGLKDFFDDKNNHITSKYRGCGHVDAGPRNLLKDNLNELCDIRNLIEKFNNKESLRLFRTMNIQAAIFLSDNQDKLRKLITNLFKNKSNQIELTEDERKLLDGLEKAQITNQTIMVNESKGQSKGLYGHYGDLFQASTYLQIPYESDDNKNCLVEFTLASGSHKLIFSPKVLALTGTHIKLEQTEVGKALASAYGGIATSNAHDGYNTGWLGLKHEGRGDFSFSVGNSISTKILLLMFVKKITICHYIYTEEKPWK